MADTVSSAVEPPADDETDEDVVVSVSTVFLALVTMAIYLLFLKPTAEDDDNANNENNANAVRQQHTGRRQQNAQGMRRGHRQQPAHPQQQQQQQQQQRRRNLPLSEAATEVLGSCRSLPPHVRPSLVAARGKPATIGGFDLLSENGLVAFSHTRAAAIGAGATGPDALLARRKERARILSRLFAATEGGGQGLPAKGSTFVVGVSRERHLEDPRQKASLLRAVGNLATHYTVLLVVEASGDGGSAEEIRSSVEGLLRGSGESGILRASVLPSHRILVAGSPTGRVALVRQLSTNIGLTVDFDPRVREELVRFGYEVAVVGDWAETLPAARA